MDRNRWVTLTVSLAAGVVLLSGAGAVVPPGETAASDLSPGPAQNRLLRQRLERTRDALDGAIRDLDAGAPARDVLRVLRDEGGRWVRGFDGDLPPRPPARPGHAGGETPEPTPEELRRRLSERLPGLAERIREIERTNPELASAFVQRLGRRVHDVELETRDDPELGRLKLDEIQSGVEVFETMRELRDGIERKELTEEQAVERLSGVLAAHYEARLAVSRHELDALRARLARMERDVETLAGDRQEEIQHRTRRMLIGLRGERPAGASGPEGRGPMARPDRP